jgi:hypothetical protein
MERTSDQVRSDIESAREQLAAAVDELRGAADLTSKLRTKLPALAAGGAATGFVLAGGIGATMRLFARRSREGREAARVGRFTIVDRG